MSQFPGAVETVVGAESHCANNFECRIINSRLFKFIVGEKSDGFPTEILVYEEAIAQLSKPMHTLTKGNLSEAQAGCTIWKEVSKETFERFVQFAYTGDYSIPDTREWDKVAEPQKGETDALVHRAPSGMSKALESKIEEEEPAEAHDELNELFRGHESGKKSKKVKEKKKAKDVRGSWGGWGTEPEPSTWQGSTTIIQTSQEKGPSTPSPPSLRLSTTNFHSLQCPLLAPLNIHHHTCEPTRHFEPNRSYSNVFLSHASLYVLGDLWLIDALKALAIYKLHKALCIFELDGKNVADIIDLARYAYKEEGKGLEDGIGRLRGIVCQYVALHAAVLSLQAVFLDFIEEGGQFARDFVQFAVQRMQ